LRPNTHHYKIAGFFLLVALSMLAGPYTVDAANNKTTVGTVSSGAVTDNSVAINATFTGNANGNGSCAYYYNTVNSYATATLAASCSNVTGTSPRSCTITGLSAGTTYYIWSLYSDTDGVNGTNPVQLAGTVTTTDARTTIVALTYTSTDTSITVNAAYTGDTPANNSCTIYINGTAQTTTKIAGAYTATASGLTPGTSYTISAIFADPDGLNGSNPSGMAATTFVRTATGTLTTSIVTDTSFDVKVTYAGDNNGDNTCAITVPGGTVSSPVKDGVNKWYTASVTGLNPNTAYTISASFADADTVAGTNPVAGSQTTTFNRTATGSLATSNVTDTSFDVKVTYAGDNNDNNTCTITVPGGTVSATVKDSVNKWYTASVTGLTANTAYTVSANFSDIVTGDGVAGTNPVTVSQTTAPSSANATTTGTITTSNVTDTSFDVKVTYTGDNNDNNSCAVSVPGGSVSAAAKDYVNKWYTSSVTGLTANTAYTVSAIFADNVAPASGDTVIGTNPVTTGRTTTFNGTYTGTLTISNVADTSFDIKVIYTGDNNDNNTCAITVPGGAVSVPVKDSVNRWYTASVTGLTANTAYTASANFTDADTVTGTNPVTGSQTTTFNRTATGSLATSNVTDTSFDVKVTYTGDNNDNNTCTIMVPGGTVSATVKDSVNKWYTASVTGLTANTAYTASANFTDADTVTGTNPVTGSQTTTPAPIPPTSTITDPAGGANLNGVTYTVSGSAVDNSGAGLAKVEVSTDGGTIWKQAAGTVSWSFEWTLPVGGSSTIKSRATDNAGNIEAVGAGVGVSVTAYGNPELQHYSWDPSLSGGSCGACHSTPARFLNTDFRRDPGFCYSCHNPAGVAHDQRLSGVGHSIMVNVTSGNGNRLPTYGNITAGETNNQPFSRLRDGKAVVCVTCHNTMQKSEDYGRVWEKTTTSDRITYSLQLGRWDVYGPMEPRVYRSTSIWTGPPYSPTYTSEKKLYLVDGSEYDYDETAGTVTFKAAQDTLNYVYVSLDYPFLRASSQDDRLCTDCHTQTTHKGNNCLTCHTAHNTGNLKGIKETVRTADRSMMQVSFNGYTGTASFADGDVTHDGICEVCHTTTKYYRRDGSGFANHSGGVNYDKKDCTSCHSHSTGFGR